jgi:hypothetical protein
MASNINPFNIDGTFPVAGQDNNSQGFRDNFTNIRNNLGFAKNEIEDLQGKVILKQPLSGGSLDNNMGGSTIRNVVLKSYRDSFYLLSKDTNDEIVVDFQDGNMQYYDLDDGPVTITNFTGWPAETDNVATTIMVWIRVGTNLNYTVTVPMQPAGAAEEWGYYDLAGGQIVGNTVVLSFDRPGNYFYEFTSSDAGLNVHVRDVSGNYASFRNPNFYLNPLLNKALLVGYDGVAARDAGLYSFEATNDHSLSVSGAVNTVTAGNLTAVSIQDNQIESFLGVGETGQGDMAGYSVTSARGNLTAGTISAVASGDYLGYFAAQTFTGNLNFNNTFQRTAAIGYYATGSNTTYGLGGNITFWTKPDGQQTLTQAMGIENNRAVRLFGNVIMNRPGDITSTAPGTAGEMFVSGTFLYVCTVTGNPGTWRRVALTAF